MVKKSTTRKNVNTKKAKKMKCRFSRTVRLTFGGGLIVLVILGATIGILAQQESRIVANYTQCVEAGGKTWGKQCEINDVKFTAKNKMNQKQLNGSSRLNYNKRLKENVNDINKSDYIGLSEEQAIVKGEGVGLRVRVIERDGEMLPMTMDYMPGRLNLSIENGLVNKVSVEGEKEQ